MEQKIYLLNAFSLSMLAPSAFTPGRGVYGGGAATILVESIDLEKAKELLNRYGFISAVGHESTAAFLSRLLGLPVPFNRVAVQLERGDVAVVFQLLSRLPEGKILTKEELAEIRYQFYYVSIIPRSPAPRWGRIFREALGEEIEDSE